MTPSTEPKTRTITLTDRPPVRIREDQWPVIAEAFGDSWTGHPGDTRYGQALQQGELNRWTIKVRQHAADGRAIVYAVFDAASFTTARQPDWRGGELVAPAGPVDIANAIRRVGESGNLPEHLIRECIADLPPEEL